jgi:hypothetical protein
VSGIEWKSPPKLMRGVVIDGVDSSTFASDSSRECWEKVASISKALANSSEPISVMCEIWPDTGRVIWIQKDRREFGRVELTIPELERKYFEISSSRQFEYDYDRLVAQVRDAVKAGAAQIDLAFANKITIRESDDSTTEEAMM